MSETAKLVIVGRPRQDILNDLETISKWDNGNNYPIYICDGNGQEVLTSIAQAELYINGDLGETIQALFGNKYTITKSGGHGEILLVDHPDMYANDGHKVKHRKATNFTPKKKRRKR